jgi:hypothetical protein
MTQLRCRELERRMKAMNLRVAELRTPEYSAAPEFYPHVTDRIDHVIAEVDRLLDEWAKLRRAAT